MKRKSRKSDSATTDLDIVETPQSFFDTAQVGKYHREYVRGAGTVRSVTLEEDVAEVFPDSTAVNNVLRAIIANMNRAGSVTKKRKKSA